MPRPSSPVGTKAFTVRPYLLHHIAKACYHFHNTTKPFRDLLYCLFILVCMFYVVYCSCFSTTHFVGKRLLLSNRFLCHADVNFRLPSNNQFLVGLTGLEPVTPRLSSACSNQLSYRPGLGLLRDSYQRLKISYQSLLFLSLFTETGGGTGTRTPDIQLAKLALYQLSYTPSCGSFRKKGRDARRTGSAQRRACFTHLV